MARRSNLALTFVLTLGWGCRSAAEPTATPQPTAESFAFDADRIAADITFLADDAQQGRAPGSKADARVRAYVVDAMLRAGLEPAGTDGWNQAFDFGDGVKSRGGGIVFGSIAHDLVPFGHDTSGTGPVEAHLIYVGWGIDPASLSDVKGKIVVARHGGPDDPHLAVAKLRPQSKLIAARDAGAVGFVLWDPDRGTPWPNSGDAADLGLPAVFVGQPGTLGLLTTFMMVKGEPKIGQLSEQPIKLGTAIEAVRRETANVVGRLAGAEGAARTIVVGAHLDHLGMGGPSSLSPDESAIHNGADDNASGVAVMLELARALGKTPRAERGFDVIFVAFGAEERGLLGSAHFVKAFVGSDAKPTAAMINFDMVGRLGEALIVNGAGTSKEWKPWLEDARGTVKLELVDDGWGPSDHASFYGEGVPVLHFFTGSHEDYHRPSDDTEKVNARGAATVAKIAHDVVDALLDSEAEMTVIELERPVAKATAFRVSLGTMPDYAAQVDGLALSGVRKGGPAEKAGLRKGDIIVKIGEREIHGIDDYMASFATMNPGQRTAFEVMREGKRVILTVVPAAPSR